MTTQETNPTESVSVKVVDFGDGRYSARAKELFRDSKRLLKLNDEIAERLAKSFISDFIRVSSLVEKIGISKPNKDGYTTIREMCKAKVKMTPSMRIAKIVSSLNEIKALGIEDFGDGIVLEESLQTWLES